ncbi:MAG: SRPBCC domain-containing protein [Parvibaculaceae bacterium]
MAGRAEAPRLELRIIRLFDAPRDVVFKLWTDAEHLVHWWGPRGFLTLACEIDLRPGGNWRIMSRAPDGMEFASYGTFHEIIVSERLVFSHSFDFPGRPLGPSTLVTARFLEEKGRTRLIFHQGIFDSIADRDGHEEGWSSAFDLIDDYLRQSAPRKDPHDRCK